MSEDYKEKSKVEMTLKDYLEITNISEERKAKINSLMCYLFLGLEKDTNGEIVFDKYKLSDKKMKSILESTFNEEYKEYIKTL